MMNNRLTHLESFQRPGRVFASLASLKLAWRLAYSFSLDRIRLQPREE